MKTISISTHLELKTFLPDFYTELAYDGSPDVEDYVPKGIWFNLMEGECFAGFINLEPLNNVMWNTHVFIYEAFRSKGSYHWGSLVAAYMREHCGARKFLAITPYEAAKRYAEKVGFTNVGVLSSSIRKNGKLLNQYMLEMSV